MTFPLPCRLSFVSRLRRVNISAVPTRLAQLEGRVTVADGAWSTVLRERGIPAGVPAEVACLTHAQVVEQLARDYVAAGARILTTNTFAANRLAWAHWGRDDWRQVNEAAVRLARRAAGEGVLVAGSIGPSGKLVAVREAPDSELAAAFAEQARTLEAGGADLIVLETFTELAEARLALRAVLEAVALPVVVSLSFSAGPQRTQTLMGAEAGACAATLEQDGADAVGCNCGAGIEHALPAAVALRANMRLPLWVKPSVGLPDLHAGRAVYPQTPDSFAAHAPRLVEAGANVIGGCCGAGPDHIRRLAALVQPERRAASRGGR
jgi:methionine synthase I (cobalamin-dependent)